MRVLDILLPDVLAGEVDKNVLEIGLFHDLRFFEATGEKGFDEVFGGVNGDDLAFIHYGETVAEDFSFVHVVSGDDDGDAGLANFLDELPEVAARLGV